MICPQCKSEMSRKWQPRSGDKVVVLSSLVWSCGVCGHQLTLADMKPYARGRQKTEHKAASILLTLPRPLSR